MKREAAVSFTSNGCGHVPMFDIKISQAVVVCASMET